MLEFKEPTQPDALPQEGASWMERGVGEEKSESSTAKPGGEAVTGADAAMSGADAATSGAVVAASGAEELSHGAEIKDLGA